MKAIIRRLHRLEEERFVTAADIEFSRRLRERLEAAQRRLAPPESGPYFEIRRQRFLEVITNAYTTRGLAGRR